MPAPVRRPRRGGERGSPGASQGRLGRPRRRDRPDRSSRRAHGSPSCSPHGAIAPEGGDVRRHHGQRRRRPAGHGSRHHQHPGAHQRHERTGTASTSQAHASRQRLRGPIARGPLGRSRDLEIPHDSGPVSRQPPSRSTAGSPAGVGPTPNDTAAPGSTVTLMATDSVADVAALRQLERDGLTRLDGAALPPWPPLELDAAHCPRPADRRPPRPGRMPRRATRARRSPGRAPPTPPGAPCRRRRLP